MSKQIAIADLSPLICYLQLCGLSHHLMKSRDFTSIWILVLFFWAFIAVYLLVAEW